MISRRKLATLLAGFGLAAPALASTTEGEDRHAALDASETFVPDLDIVREAVISELTSYSNGWMNNGKFGQFEYLASGDIRKDRDAIAQGVVDRLRLKLGIPD